MKTPDEIKKGLRACIAGECHSKRHECPYRKESECTMALAEDSLALIRQLEAEIMNLENHIRDITKMVPNWISVEDRLPEFHEKVVVSDGKHAWDYGMYGGWYGRKDAWQWKHNTVRHVKWWMPKKDALPEPPKEGKHE